MTELEIEAFLAIVRTGSISAAAQKLYVTQPALSRRIHALEQELGYSLMVRKKGVRSIELTSQGKAFISLAEKWKTVWNESRELRNPDRSRTFQIASVVSVSTYLLPNVLKRFMELRPDCSLNFHHCHSLESYGYVERGEMDLALISDDMFSHTVETVPAFKGKMVLATRQSFEHSPGPLSLDPKKEIRLPWDPEYDLWHDYWFGPRVRPRVMLDQMSLMEYFLREKECWVIVPEYIARILTDQAKDRGGLNLYEMEDGPPESVIYYLIKKGRSPAHAAGFLEVMRQVLEHQEGVTVLM